MRRTFCPTHIRRNHLPKNYTNPQKITPIPPKNYTTPPKKFLNTPGFPVSIGVAKPDVCHRGEKGDLMIRAILVFIYLYWLALTVVGVFVWLLNMFNCKIEAYGQSMVTTFMTVVSSLNWMCYIYKIYVCCEFLTPHFCPFSCFRHVTECKFATLIPYRPTPDIP